MMNEEKETRRNDLIAEMESLRSGLTNNTSDFGDWKIVKIYEARMSGEPDPYDFEELKARRDRARARINELQEELASLADE